MVLKFIDRKKELFFLNERYKSKTAEFIPVYGRRRVGKTYIIKKFIEKKHHFYFLARKRDAELEIRSLADKISEKFNVFLGNVNSWEQLFKGIIEKIVRTQDEKFIIAIDEFPYWIEKDKSVVSEFQYLWDELLSKENVFLILCGSSVRMMETDVLGFKSPLYGRRTGQMKIKKLKFRDFIRFFPGTEIEEMIKFYGCIDGMPFYINELDKDKSLIENIKNTFWRADSILNAEAEFLLREELREVEKYLDIMKGVFYGSTTLNEIATKSKTDITNINKYLNNLINLGFVKKEYSVIRNRHKGKDFIYKINDNYFRFWLRYVHSFQSDIEIGEVGNLVAFFKKDYPSFMGRVFEEICLEFISGHKTGQFNKVGRWWGHYRDKNNERKEVEIDIVALNEDTKEILFAECKWKSKVNGEKLLKDLVEKSSHVKWNNDKRKERFAIFAKSFSKRPPKSDALAFDLKDIEKNTSF